MPWFTWSFNCSQCATSTAMSAIHDQDGRPWSTTCSKCGNVRNFVPKNDKASSDFTLVAVPAQKSDGIGLPTL